ncbi:prepilin-type N-terminal cleavage/methylation domain-containing protein [Kiritimatiellaeota bacterium B1221]|nr:prepilin-type N-terminal cleavage/methylation domain-containing protein [Kiritimatiellaeota bacterium B1221]
MKIKRLTTSVLPAHSRLGFTLIEMLVVIAIIALLASMIVPAVTGALRSATHAKSMSNLRQWGTSLYLHLYDSQGKLPSRGPNQQPTWTLASSTSQEAVRKAWYNVLPPYVNESAIADVPRADRKIFLEGESIHRDPQAEFDTAQLIVRPLFSYCFNSQLNTSRQYGDNIPGQGDLRQKSLDITMYPSPSNTVMFFESRVGEGDGDPSQNSNSQYARAYGHSRHLSFRYGGKVNLLFLDGSVARFNSKDLFNGTEVVNDAVYWSGLE